MNESTRHNTMSSSDDEPVQDEPIQGDGVHAEAARDEAAAEPGLAGDGSAGEMEALRGELEELNHKYLRALADYQNFARRSAQNIDAAREETRMQMAKALITVMDHFDHALEADPEKSTTEDLLRGVQIVRDELLRVLEQFGVRRLEAEVGGEFDPNRHEALMRQPVEGLDADAIAQQLQVGYTLGDKTLRPAKVAVAE